MRSPRLELTQPGLIDAIRHPRAMAIWECLRRRRAPTTAAELARAVGQGLADVQAAFDVLAAAGLVRVRKATSRRRRITYETSVRDISIMLDPRDAKQVRLLRAIVDYIGRDLEPEHFRNAIPITDAGKDHWNYHHCSPMSLDAADLEELKRRIARVEEFIRLLNDKQGRAGTISRCNHAIAIRIEPLGGNVLPQPHVELISPQSMRDRAATRGLGLRPLTPREREIARGLRAGQSRGEVATSLGISVLTVGTLCKRLYRKLGIRRAADLHNFSLG